MPPNRPLKALCNSENPKPCLLSSMLADTSQNREGKDMSMLENVVINTSGTAYAGRSGYYVDASRNLRWPCPILRRRPSSRSC